jgi:photosystem II stability/assembly factor-like uncharacterized protein
MRLACLALTAATALIDASLADGHFDAMEYRNIGPARGGRVTAVAGTAAEPGTFYLGATGGGVWKTTDFGTTWLPVSDGYFASPSIGDIAVAQHDPNIVYVGTGSDGLRSNVIPGRGVYKSVDGGQTWKHAGLTATAHIGAVEIDPTNHNVVWVAAIGNAFAANEERGLYKTTDGGRTWEHVLFLSDTVGITDVELLPGNPQIVFASAWKARRQPWTIESGGPAEEGGIFKSVDGGARWERVTQGLPDDLLGKIDLAISAADSSRIYALVEAPDDQGGVYRSMDQGETWEQVSHHDGIRTRPFYYTNLEAHPTDPDTLWVMATGYFKSTDGGETWKRASVPHGDNHDMWINPNNPDIFIQGNDGGANVTLNGGGSWSTQFNQPTAELYQVEVDDQYPYWLYGGQQDNSTTIAVPSQAPYNRQHPAGYLTDTGGCETGPAVPKPGNHNIVYANCKGRFGVYDKRTGTEKQYYVGAANMYGHNPADLRYRFQRVAPIHVSPHDADVVYHASQYVHRTTDDGRSWETISPDLTAFEADKQVISGSPITRDITGEEFYSTIYALRESPVQAGVIWVGANDGPVHVTRDNGNRWERVTPGGVGPGGRVDAVEPSPHDVAKAYVAILRYQLGDDRPYLYRTEDFGASWTLLTDGRNGIPADCPTRVIREDPVRAGLLFAGADCGMFVSLDDGASWQSFQQNLPVTPVTDIRIVRGDLALSTMGRSFWVLDNITALRQASIDALGDEVVLFEPKDTILYRRTYRNAGDRPVPDYPAPAVTIDYYLPAGSPEQVTLEIRDADGELVNAFATQQDDGGTADTGAGTDDPADDSLMRTGRPRVIELEELTANVGANRFRWTMRHAGPWADDADARYRRGPLVAPGEYTLRLTAGDATVAQTVSLLSDPRLAAQGTTMADIQAQVALELRVVALLSRARRLVHSLEEKEAADGLSDREAEALAKLRTADGTYMQPMLTSQISYLYGMISRAEQAPGQEALARFEVLEAELNRISATLED